MGFLLNIIMRIVFFLFFIVVVDMLAPSSTFRKYTKLVTSFLFILLLLNPILELFNKGQDIDKAMELILQQFSNEEKKISETKLERQKKEIFSNKQAYILEEMAVQLKSEMKEGLVAQFEYDIKSLNIKLKDDEKDLGLENIALIVIELQPYENKKDVDIVQSVDISLNKSTSINKSNKNEEEIKEWCSNQFEIPVELLEIVILKD